MDLKTAVRVAAAENNIDGVMRMSEHCGLSYPRTARVWNGDTSAKISDVTKVLESLGKQLKCVSKVKV